MCQLRKMDLAVINSNDEGAMCTSYMSAWIVAAFCSTPYTQNITLQLAHCLPTVAKVHNVSKQQLVLQLFFTKIRTDSI